MVWFQIEEFARQAVAHTVNGWFSKMKGNVPNMRNEQHSYDSITSRQSEEEVGGGGGSRHGYEVIVTVKNLKLTYETGTLVEDFKTVQPDTITVNPPTPFTFKALGGQGKFDVNDIRGKLTIDGSSNFESVGDKVIVHNGSGANDNSLVTNRQIPRMEVDGKEYEQ